jgi:two-component system LytT family response regulator
MIRTIIVEDEPLARDLLRSYIAMHDDIELVGEASNGKEGLALVNELAPDLLLLDIQMPEMSGVALAREMKRDPAIVFVTAHDAHAMAAFELGAFDYLLKPVLPARFDTSMERIRERRAAGAPAEHLRDRMDSVLHDGLLQHFFVRHLGKLIPVQVSEIVRLESDDDYTAVHVGGKRHLVHVPLREMATRLDPKTFVRVHRCDIVNLGHVKSASYDSRHIVLKMSDGSEVTTSRSGAQALQDLRF